MLAQRSRDFLDYREKRPADPIEQKEDLVEFTLLYSGEMLASGNSNTRPKVKHAIRRAFHPQLRRLWNTNRNLRSLAIKSGQSVNPSMEKTEDEKVADGVDAIGRNFTKAGYNIVPLVTEALALQVAIEIHMLRPTDKPLVFKQGDIDGQLKTIFDSLRVPQDRNETGNADPEADENPLFVLLEDDRLISEVHVTTGELLLLPGERELKANDVFASVRVRLNHRYAGTFDRYFS